MTVRKIQRTVCDRCDTEASPADGVWVVNACLSDLTGEISGHGDIPARFDLCPDCRDSLIEWWGKGERFPSSP